jgi:hypothetical protein
MAYDEIIPGGEDEVESESSKIYGTDPKSNSVAGLIEGLQILAKYMKKGLDTKFFCGGEHDIVYFYTDTPSDEEGGLTSESPDGLRLSALGFYLDEDVDNWAYNT